MSKIRVMFVGHGPSALPEDAIVNTFHFVGTGAYATDVTSAYTQVESFYNGVAGQSESIASWLSPWIQRLAETRSYDLEQPKPRIPLITPFTLGATGPAGYAEECAVCLSYRGALPSTPRRRGRIYLGPLKEGAIVAGSSGIPTRPQAALIDDLRVAAIELAGNADCTWSIRSSLPTENFVPIVAGYVDNALDTQRRRGPKPTARSTWASPGL